MCANDAEKGQRLFLIRPEGEGEQEGAPFTVVQHSQWMLVAKSITSMSDEANNVSQKSVTLTSCLFALFWKET